jgi:hypothetical protein
MSDIQEKSTCEINSRKGKDKNKDKDKETYN